MLSIFLIGSALVYMFGKWVGNTRQGWSIWAAMFILFSVGYFVAVGAEQNGNALIASQAHVRHGGQRDAAGRQHGGQGGALRHRRLRALRHGSPPTPRAAHQ